MQTFDNGMPRSADSGSSSKDYVLSLSYPSIPLAIYKETAVTSLFVGLGMAAGCVYGKVDGWRTFLLFLLVLGIIGEYIGNIFVEMKNRPLYIVSRKLKMEAHPMTVKDFCV